MKDVYAKHVEIVPDDSVVIDHSLIQHAQNYRFVPKSWLELVQPCTIVMNVLMEPLKNKVLMIMEAQAPSVVLLLASSLKAVFEKFVF